MAGGNVSDDGQNINVSVCPSACADGNSVRLHDMPVRTSDNLNNKNLAQSAERKRLQKFEH